MSRSASPNGSVTSSTSSTRPSAPVKPAHLSSSLTRTCGSTTLHNYIQAQKTGDSFTSASESPSRTLSKTHVGYGYPSSFDSCVDDSNSKEENKPRGEATNLATGTCRPTMRGRTNTAPSVTNLFSPEVDNDRNDTMRLVRHEPIAINGFGASKVGKLRHLFEASTSESKAPPVPLTRQNTGAYGRPKISDAVRQLQAQITGEQIDDTWNTAQFQRHSQDSSTQSTESSNYGTARETLLNDALKMDAIITLPEVLPEEDASTRSRESFSENMYTPKLNRTLIEHSQDDSTATIKPLRQFAQQHDTPSQSTNRNDISPTRHGERLTSLVPSTAEVAVGDDSNSSSPSQDPASLSPSRSRNASQSDDDALMQDHQRQDVDDNDRSRDPSVLADESGSFIDSQHLRIDDGSCFDLDWRANDSPSKSRSTASPAAMEADLSLIPVLSLPDPGSNPVVAPASPVQSRPTSSRILRPGTGKAARALFDFEGEAAFNELSLVAGQAFEIINEELAGGWSLGVVWSDTEPPRRGLIPQGWYSFEPGSASSAAAVRITSEPVSTPTVVGNIASQDIDTDKSPPSVQGIEGKLETRPLSPQFVDDALAPPAPDEAGVSPRQSAVMDNSSPDRPVIGASKETTTTLRNLAADPAAQGRISNRPSESKIFSASQADRILQFEQLLAQSTDKKTPVGPPPAALPVSSPALQSLSELIKPQATLPEHVKDVSVLTSQTPIPTIKASIFGKKTFNRFASFVTTGAEDYVLSDTDAPEDERLRSMARKVSAGRVPTLGEQVESAGESTSAQCDEVETDESHHFVVAGPAGPQWKSKVPTFLVQVHHPEKRSKMNGVQEYTIYHVTSTYPVEGQDDDARGALYDPIGGPYPPGVQVTVIRRFTQFEWLHQVLNRHYAALVVPAVPEKQYSGRFASDFIETRRADLELWMSRIVRHPVLRYSEAVQFFLGCNDDNEWRSKAGTLLRGESKSVQAGIFARTWHPDFNFDAADAATEASSMDLYLRAAEKTINGVGGDHVGKGGLLSSFKNHRDTNVQTSSSYRNLSYTMLRMLTGAGAGNSNSDMQEIPRTHAVHGPPLGNVGKRSEIGATNVHGAWCWRDACHECTNLTSALQNTAESLQNIADLFDNHAREALLRQHERVKDVSRPHANVQTLIETHKTTLAKYRIASGDVDDDHEARGSAKQKELHPEEAEKLASRCETVLNVTLCEMDRIHNERVEDWHAIGRGFLDSEIDMYESILETLRAARLHYEPQYYDREEGTHILASRYQPDLARPRKPPAPLQMPSQAQVPSVGLGSNVGMLISQATGGVTRPASTGTYSHVDDDSYSLHGTVVESPASGFVANLLSKNKRSTPNLSAAARSPSSSPNIFSEYTNLPIPSKRSAAGARTEPFSQAGETLKAISQRQSQDDQRGSYFSAIWR